MAIDKAIEYKMQGSKKPAKNYLGKQKTVSKVPVKWQSGPDTPPTELAYITEAEKDLILKADLHGSLKDGPNTGPDGIMSLDSQGDYTRDRSPGAYGGGSRQSRDRNEQHMREILTGQKNIGQTTKTGPKTRKYAVPEYVRVKQPGGGYKNTYIGSGYKSYGTPSFFGNLFSRGARGYRGIKGMPAFFGKPGFEFRQGPDGMGYYSDKENFGETRDQVPFGIMGIIGNILNKFRKPPIDYSDMSEFNKLQNIDGQVIDPTGLELNKGAFGFPVNQTVDTTGIDNSLALNSFFNNQKPPANITGTNLNDFQIGDPGKYATANMINEFGVKAGTADDIGLIGMPGTADDRVANLYEDNVNFNDQVSLPGNNIVAEITDKDRQMMNTPVGQMMDYDTFKTISGNDTLTEQEFNQLKTQVG